jgi:hypothetical protein
MAMLHYTIKYRVVEKGEYSFAKIAKVTAIYL